MNCYIVTLVSQSNDFVIAVVEDEEEAKRVAAECEADSIPEDIQDVYGYYGSRVTGVQIIHVENGRPVCEELVREFAGGKPMSKLDDQIKRLAAWLDEDGDDCEFRSVELHRPAYEADGEPLKEPEWAVLLRDDFLHSTASADSTDLPEALHDALDRMNAKP